MDHYNEIKSAVDSVNSAISEAVIRSYESSPEVMSARSLGELNEKFDELVSKTESDARTNRRYQIIAISIALLTFIAAVAALVAQLVR